MFEGQESRATREVLAACQMLGIRWQRAPCMKGAPQALVGACPPIDMWILVDEPAAASLVKELRAAGFRACIYVVAVASTAPGVEADVLDAGADGYSEAPVERDTLAARFRSALRRKSGTYLAAMAPKVGLSRERRVLLVGEHEYLLSRRELVLIDYLRSRAGQWVRRDQLLQDVFGAQNGYDSSLARTHILNIRKKLGSDNWLLRSDRQQGVMLVQALEETG